MGMSRGVSEGTSEGVSRRGSDASRDGYNRGPDNSKSIQRYSSHLLTTSNFIRVIGSHFLSILVIGPKKWPYEAKKKQKLLYPIPS